MPLVVRQLRGGCVGGWVWMVLSTAEYSGSKSLDKHRTHDIFAFNDCKIYIQVYSALLLNNQTSPLEINCLSDAVFN